MKPILQKLFGSVCLLLLGIVSLAQPLKQFKKGERVVFVGNSITDGGHYHSYIWLYYMTHFPGRRIDVFNAGIGGDIAMQINDRLETDVFVHKPTIITLTFGMNDTGYGEYLRENAKEFADKRVQQSFASYQLIEKKLQNYTGARKMMIASSPYDETSKIKTRALIGKNDALLRVASFQEESAKKNQWEFLDFNRSMVAINLREQKKDTLFTLCGQDRIHPANDGHFVMAYLFLKQQGLSGLKVSAIEVDAAGTKILNAENCQLSNLRKTGSTFSFDYLSNSLPYPIDTVARGGSGGMSSKKQSDALNIIPFMEEFNTESLLVKGLKESSEYRVKIDSTVIGKWTGAELSKGVNLATITTTPQYQQALSIMQMNEERWEIERRLREYYWLHYSILTRKGLLFNDNESTMDSVRLYARRDPFVRGVINTYQKARFPAVREAWKKQIALITDQIYSVNGPKKRRIIIELIP